MASYQRKGNWLSYQTTKQEEESSLAITLLNRFQLKGGVLNKLIARNGVQVNGQKYDLTQAVHTGDRIQVLLFEEEGYGVEPEPIPIDVLYEDDHILVVNKAAGVAVHPTETEQKGTLAHAIAFHYQLHGQQIKVRHVHRLDKDTSGVLLLAKHAIAHALLDEALRDRKIKRQYIAVASGILKAKVGKIEEPIGRDRHHPTRRRVSPKGDHAVTYYRLIEQFNDGAILQLELETGRTHQIRVHLSYIGHPIYGDTMYGGPRYPIRRQALHGERLRFWHPIFGEEIEVVAPIPDDMQSLITYLQNG